MGLCPTPPLLILQVEQTPLDLDHLRTEDVGLRPLRHLPEIRWSGSRLRTGQFRHQDGPPALIVLMLKHLRCRNGHVPSSIMEGNGGALRGVYPSLVMVLVIGGRMTIRTAKGMVCAYRLRQSSFGRWAVRMVLLSRKGLRQFSKRSPKTGEQRILFGRCEGDESNNDEAVVRLDPPSHSDESRILQTTQNARLVPLTITPSMSGASEPGSHLWTICWWYGTINHEVREEAIELRYER